jgi:hypothetical protein
MTLLSSSCDFCAADTTPRVLSRVVARAPTQSHMRYGCRYTGTIRGPMFRSNSSCSSDDRVPA